MMKAIIGDKYLTQMGVFIIPKDQNAEVSIGDRIWHDGSEYRIDAIVPPSKPYGKWSIKVTRD